MAQDSRFGLCEDDRIFGLLIIKFLNVFGVIAPDSYDFHETKLEGRMPVFCRYTD